MTYGSVYLATANSGQGARLMRHRRVHGNDQVELVEEQRCVPKVVQAGRQILDADVRRELRQLLAPVAGLETV
jgi:hypothetical protein